MIESAVLFVCVHALAVYRIAPYVANCRVEEIAESPGFTAV